MLNRCFALHVDALPESTAIHLIHVWFGNEAPDLIRMRQVVQVYTLEQYLSSSLAWNIKLEKLAFFVAEENTEENIKSELWNCHFP